MGFVGPAVEVRGRWVRPHDIALLPYAEEDTEEAIVTDVNRIGFEVRVELALGDGEPVRALLTRDEAQELELEPGRIVHLRADAARTLTG
jgi:sulfate transport system ATP-binding protein